MSRYIDADKLKTVIEKNFGHGTISPILQIIDQQSTDDVVEVVHGKWEECEIVQEHGDEPIIDEWQSAKCSVCGKYHTTPYMYHFDHFNYCPNCGARMDGEEE